VLALPAGLTTLRFLPPLVVEQGDLARVVDAVRDVLKEEVSA
jgi:acetylornithine/LysW-gamma-L-lysine aminotransferase